MSDFIKAFPKNELPAGKGKSVELNGVRLAVFNAAGTFYACENYCTHADAPLADGWLTEDACVECPWHGARFDLKTGQALTPPAHGAVKVYPVRLNGEDVEVQLDAKPAQG